MLVLIRSFLAHWMSFFYEHDQVSVVGMKVAVLCSFNSVFYLEGGDLFVI